MIEPLIPPPQFLQRAEELNIAFEPGDIERLGCYLALLLDANTRFNLTSITDPEAAWTRHILDSLAVIPLIASLDARSLIDVGSGGGLPGIPIAITMPDLAVTLLEPTGKKARFLEETAAQLNLANVTVINDRAETIGQDVAHHRERYDIVTARAVGPLPVLLELTVPLARVGGHVLAIKGAKAAEEVDASRIALHKLHTRVIELVPTATSTIIVIDKPRKTPHLYPRKPGEPKRSPL